MHCFSPASPSSPHLQVSGDLDSLTDDLAHVVAGLPRPPVLVAHSFGALLAEKYMTGGRGACKWDGRLATGMSSLWDDRVAAHLQSRMVPGARWFDG